jgi:hypothetical protein
MTWLIWRQHRLQWAIAAVLIAGFAVPLFLSGRTRAGCTAGSPCFVDVPGSALAQTLANLSVAVPVLIGAFWGVALAGRELETGTAALVWTQSVPRSVWLRAKVTTLLVSSLLCSAAVSGLVTWWARPGSPSYNNRFEAIHFDAQGVVPVAYTMFAAALGLCAGTVWRRTLPAIATTVGGYLGVRLLIELLARPHYDSPVVRLYPMNGADPTPPGSMGISNDLLQHGHVVTGPVRVACDGGPGVTREQMNACMHQLGYEMRSIYQPADRYWPFQWIEFGIFLGLAVALTVGAIILLRRRDA